MFEHEQSNRDGGERIHDRVYLPASARHQVETDVGDKAPEDSLRDGEGQGNEDDRQKCRKGIFDSLEGELRDALKHRRADEYQNRGGRVSWHAPCQRGEKETGNRAREHW